MDVKIKVGTRLRELRIKNNLTQQQLSMVADIDRTYISDVENGRRNISIETLETLIKGLNVSLAQFFNKGGFKNL